MKMDRRSPRPSAALVDARPPRLRVMAALFSVAVALNFPWEMAQAVLYQPMGSIADATRRCFVASVGDGLMILAVAMAGAVIHGDAWWFRRWSTAAAVLTVVADANRRRSRMVGALERAVGVSRHYAARPRPRIRGGAAVADPSAGSGHALDDRPLALAALARCVTVAC